MLCAPTRKDLIVTDIPRASFLDRARLALVEDDTDQREQIYNDLIDELESLFGKNDKEVAAELQRIAKTIEEQGDPDSAFAFKQRACEMLLKRNMATRRAQGRPPAPPAGGLDRTTLTGLKPLNRLLQTLECICMPSQNVERDSEFYRSNVNADQVFSHTVGTRIIGLKVSSGPVLLLMNSTEMHQCPIYSADDPAHVLAELAKQKVEPNVGPIPTAVGTIYGFTDPSGNHFGLIDKKKKL